MESVLLVPSSHTQCGLSGEMGKPKQVGPGEKADPEGKAESKED